MSRIVIGLLALAALLEALTRVESSPLAVFLTELQSQLGGVSVSGVVALLGLGMWGQQLVNRFLTKTKEEEAIRESRSGPRVIAVPETLKLDSVKTRAPAPKAAGGPPASTASTASPGGAWGEDVGGAWGEDIVSLEGAWGEAVPPSHAGPTPLGAPAPPPAEGELVFGSSEAQGTEWLPIAMQRAKSLELGPGAAIRMAIGTPVPFTLQLVSVPHERRRREIERFVGFLAGIATPPRVSVHYRSCEDGTEDRYLVVSTLLQAVFPKSTFKAYRQGDTVEVVFLNPDPRWEMF